ncbi:uncharacterized protein CLAFUR5_07162 [Fulvia fulva]|uniref:SUN-like protein 1 n=1 Tax=Passalora fulva TaxID=5499 RepID=A0A9Q8LJ63_PASFU|nr:uncharacterized protein CLAFUR5_07162 [Fulvia fulva]UJO18487.1 hypothetical protein CLAFUR5_07162 [Fulvia fulva]
MHDLGKILAWLPFRQSVQLLLSRVLQQPSLSANLSRNRSAYAGQQCSNEMYRVLRDVVVFLCIRGAIGTTGSNNTTTTTTASVPISSKISPLGTSLGSTASSSPSVNATCPSRTANYITHTLPQKCLRTDRAPHNASKAHETNVTDVSTTVTSTTTVIEVVDTTTLAAWTGSVTVGASDSAAATAQDDCLPTPPTVSEVATSTITAVRESPTEEESESPLDNANFLSFEDWKRQNLERLGQSPENIGRSQPANPHRPRPGINNALDTLGEESEIDLDFSGFGGAVQQPVPDDPRGGTASSAVPTVDVQQGGHAVHRSKDAGKTCKERTNYASFDCSATVLKSNKELKSASSVLIENKDSYALNTCSATNKFFIVELCDDIQVDTIVLANYEFFSSTFRHFRVSVSDRYPVKMEKWKELGTFEARNTREIQAFLVENPLIWAKYLRIEFLSQYGTEHFCPISLLRVHGTTMIEDYRHQEDFARGDDDDEAALEPEVVPIAPIAQEPATSSDSSTVEAISSTVVAESKPSAGEPQKQAESEERAASQPGWVEKLVPNAAADLNVTGTMQVGAYQPSNGNMTCESPTVTSGVEATSESYKIPGLSGAVSPSAEPSFSPESITGEETPASAAKETSNSTNSTVTSALTSLPHIASTGPEQSPESQIPGTSFSPVPSSETHNKTVPEGTVPDAALHSASPIESMIAPNNVTTTPPSAQSATSTNPTRAVASSTASEKPPQPSSQESFFKSFNKRLNQLEANSTLSLQYIEEQSRILRDAFSKVEKRQLGTTTKFLSQLNETVMVELHGFRQAYDQLWQSTVLELESQRETYQREMLALSSRLTMVADELVWQKRMGIVQSTLLLLCLALVLFGRNGNTLEVPLMQSMMNRSTAALRAGWDSPPNSPSPDSRSPVSLFRRKLWRASTEPTVEPCNLTDSEASRPQSRNGLDVHDEPPSPRTSHGDFEDDRAGGDSSPDLQRPIQDSQPSSPEKKRKKRPKKPPNWPQGPGLGPNGRPKSPLAL